MKAKLSWNCDFCGKPEITISLAGILYCGNCRKSYGEQISRGGIENEGHRGTNKRIGQ